MSGCNTPPRTSLDQVFGEYVASLGAADLHSAVAADYLHVEALMTASRIIREAGGDPARELKREWSDGGGEDAAYEMLRTALCYRDQHVSKGGSSVAKARAYLSQHFAEPNLMLQDVARAACMSNSRLSTVFAQETGYTFTEYLTGPAHRARPRSFCAWAACAPPRWPLP